MPGFLSKLRAENLFKNSAFLLGNLLLTTGCGFGALTLLTHIFSTSAVGLSGTAVSGCVLVQNITQFGISDSIPRFLPTAKNRSTLINTVLTTIVLSTVLVAAIFLNLPNAKGYFALGGWTFAALFILAACVLAAELVLATVLVADRAADKMATANIAPNLLGLAAPVGLMFLGGLGAFLARVVSDVASCIAYTVIIVKRGHRFRPELDFTGMREIIRFSGGMHLANIIGGLPTLVLPLMVFSRVGATDAAYWAVAMSIASFLFQLPGLVIRALLPEASFRPTERRHLFRRSALLVPALVLPALALAFFFSPIALAIFGGAYAHGALGPLRWLILAALVSMPLSVLGAILVVARKSLMTTVANAVDAVVVLGLVELWAKNVDQIAICWTIGELGNIVLFGIFAVAALREVGWRWEDLGGSAQADSAVRPVPRDRSTVRQLQGLDQLMAIAEQQRTTGEYDAFLRRRYGLTDSRGLFTVAAFQAAEQRRAQKTAPPTTVQPIVPAASSVPDAPSAPQRPGPPDESPQPALDMLFKMAESQRSADLHDPDYTQAPRGDYPYD